MSIHIPVCNQKLKDKLNGLKKIKINGIRFSIKKLNPLLDFPSDKMPQIFSHYLKRKPVKEDLNQEISIQQLRQSLSEMKLIVEAGVVAPQFSPQLITIDDIFRFGDTGAKLYLEILAHSLNQFSGLKGVFFSIRIKHSLFTTWRKNMASFQST